MSIHLFFVDGWEVALKDSEHAAALEAGRKMLSSREACEAEIARHQGGQPHPAFARERPDISGISAKLHMADDRGHVVVVGNGGSIRNVWALYQALFKSEWPRRLHLLDGTDPSGLLGELLAGGSFTPKNTLIVPVSKSGNTENVVQEVELLLERGYPMAAVTSPTPSKLASLIEERSLEQFPHPVEVGGRFTAGQNNALLPLALVTGETESIRQIDESFAAHHERLAPSVPLEENIAKTLAFSLWQAELAGYGELFVPIYAKALAGVGELIVQLVHESYCKEGAGQTLLFAEAPESQHHTNQRYFGGRPTMAGLTIRVAGFENDQTLGRDVSLGAFLDLEHAGVVAEAERAGNPHMVLTLDSLSIADVTAAIALWQWVAVYGGILRGVNPFDQPAVEGSKRTTVEMFEGFGPGIQADLARFVDKARVRL